jgi:hypothetical protein
MFEAMKSIEAVTLAERPVTSPTQHP